MSFPYQKICFELVADLPDRSRDVLVKRFGLEGDSPLTLEAIGQEHGITRERVRQLVEDGLFRVRERSQQKKGTLHKMFQGFGDVLKKSGNLKREDAFIESLGATEQTHPVVFLLHVGDNLYNHKENEDFHPFWTNKQDFVATVPTTHKHLVSFLQKQGKPISHENLRNVAGMQSFNPKTLESFLDASKHVFQGYDGNWGLKDWPEIYPKGIRDKAYVVLKHAKVPLHFLEVSERIGELQARLPYGKAREVLSQTVHNELIKDKRFVLVGRGTYALAEWGFEQGTVKDVLSQILQEAKKALDKETIVERALQQRQVKESTVLLNLQNKRYFQKNNQGKYYLGNGS